MRYTYPPDCKTSDQRKEFRVQSRKNRKKKAREVVPVIREKHKGNGWQRGYPVNKYYGNTKSVRAKQREVNEYLKSMKP